MLAAGSEGTFMPEQRLGLRLGGVRDRLPGGWDLDLGAHAPGSLRSDTLRDPERNGLRLISTLA